MPHAEMFQPTLDELPASGPRWATNHEPFAKPMPDMTSIVLATRNAGKVAEMQALLKGLPVRLISAAELEDAPDVEEDALDLEGNARKKAEALSAHTGLLALADDTGLEVDALGGRPGRALGSLCRTGCPRRRQPRLSPRKTQRPYRPRCAVPDSDCAGRSRRSALL